MRWSTGSSSPSPLGRRGRPWRCRDDHQCFTRVPREWSDPVLRGVGPVGDRRTAARVWKLPESAPSPAELAAAWTRVIENGLAAMRSPPAASLAFDPMAPARAMFDFTTQLWSNPMAVLQASQAAASEWAEFWGTA